MADKNERIFGLIGFPLSHSFSQNYFNQKFKSEGINARYLNFELPDIGDLMEVVAEYPNLCGLNVTHTLQRAGHSLSRLDGQRCQKDRGGQCNQVYT